MWALALKHSIYCRANFWRCVCNFEERQNLAAISLPVGCLCGDAQSPQMTDVKLRLVLAEYRELRSFYCSPNKLLQDLFVHRPSLKYLRIHRKNSNATQTVYRAFREQEDRTRILLGRLEEGVLFAAIRPEKYR